MRTSAASGPPSKTVSWERGVPWGLAIGATICAFYFVQASVFDWLFWDVFVVSALGLVLIGAAILGVARPHLRAFSWGLACGALITMPAALLALALLFAALNLE